MEGAVVADVVLEPVELFQCDVQEIAVAAYEPAVAAAEQVDHLAGGCRVVAQFGASPSGLEEVMPDGLLVKVGAVLEKPLERFSAAAVGELGGPNGRTVATSAVVRRRPM